MERAMGRGGMPMSSSDGPRLAVVIVTYNSASVLTGALTSLESVDGVDLVAVVVADNASRDDSLAIAERSALPLTTVQLGRNAGYSAAINAGLAVLDPAKLDAVF